MAKIYFAWRMALVATGGQYYTGLFPCVQSTAAAP
jgi:hypothetical protein